MVRIAVTGGIACGKSVVGSILRGWGLEVCEADDIAHALLVPGEPVFSEVVRRFGRGILGSDGRVDRGVLGRLVFADGRRLLELNALMHPEVMRRVSAWLQQRAGGAGAAVAVVPLLYEAGGGSGWDAVICVSSPEAEQLRRLGARGLTPEESRVRVAAQWPLEEKEKRADYVICNRGGLALLERQTRIVTARILGDSTWLTTITRSAE